MPTVFDDITRFMQPDSGVDGGYGPKIRLNAKDSLGAVCIAGHFTGVVQLQVSNDGRDDDSDDGWESLGTAQTGTGDTYYYNDEAIATDF